LVKEFYFDPDPELDPDPYLELPEKPDPDPKKIISDPTHCFGSKIKLAPSTS